MRLLHRQLERQGCPTIDTIDLCACQAVVADDGGRPSDLNPVIGQRIIIRIARLGAVERETRSAGTVWSAPAFALGALVRFSNVAW